VIVAGHVNKPGVANASLHCQGGNVIVSVNDALKQFQANFQGVTFEDCELYQPCLIALCGEANVVFDAPSIEGIQLRGFGEGRLCQACFASADAFDS
jgi:hypothetical protein